MSAPLLIAEFGDAERALAAARALRELGYEALDAFTPYPLPELESALGVRRPWWIPALVLLAACCGGSLAYLVIWWTAAVDYPLDVGGRPLDSFPADIPLIFEAAVLCAALTAFVVALLSSGMPRLNHPLERVPGFERTTIDRFWLRIVNSERLDNGSLLEVLKRLGALAVHAPEVSEA